MVTVPDLHDECLRRIVAEDVADFDHDGMGTGLIVRMAIGLQG
jgi:hypothetical protein